MREKFIGQDQENTDSGFANEEGERAAALDHLNNTKDIKTTFQSAWNIKDDALPETNAHER